MNELIQWILQELEYAVGASSLLLQVQVASGIPLSEFYPFGREAGDSVLPRVPGAVAVIDTFPFYGLWTRC